jgi:uncharacterized membrane protein YcaP (DUF421 family)
MQNLFSQWVADIFSHPDLAGALVIAGKTAVVYLFLIAGLRLLGKRELGQMSVYDLVLIVVIANAVQNAMVGPDNSLGGGLVAAATLLLMNRGLTWLLLQRRGFRHWMLGDPVLIVRDGHLLPDAMRREGITRDHVLAAMREHGIGDLGDVQMAVLEVDGAISIVPKDASVQRTHRRFRGLRVT